MAISSASRLARISSAGTVTATATGLASSSATAAPTSMRVASHSPSSGRWSASLTMDSTSFGAYWTHLGPSNWYVDAVLMASWFDGDPRSTRGVGLNADGTSLTASLEAGYPIPIGAGWAFEPQAQLIWQHVKFDQAQDPFATVHFDPDDALTGRIGARLFGDAALGSTKLKPYLLANVWRTFSGSDTTTFNTTPITTDFGNTSLELGGGVVAQLSRSVGVAAAASYITNLGGDHRQGVKGNIELRVTW